jgi:hypothetical protein
MLPTRRGAPPIISQVSDPDARDYIRRVQAADGTPLELAIMRAVNALVAGVKADGDWANIENAWLFAGVRTLAGAAVPLKGSIAPTLVNFVSADYSRASGLLGDGVSKTVNLNINNTAFGTQNSKHAASWMTQISTVASQTITGNPIAGGTCLRTSAVTTQILARNNSSNNQIVAGNVAGFIGVNRSSASNQTLRADSVSSIAANNSALPGSISMYFMSQTGSINFYAGRGAFLSFGGSVDLARYQTRLAAFFAALAAANI